MRHLTVTTATLSIACGEWGPAAGPAVLLLHGFPCDPQAYAEVAPVLAAAGRRVIVPYLRGYGPTRFLSADTMRSGQQAALAQDALDLMDALGIGRHRLGLRLGRPGGLRARGPGAGPGGRSGQCRRLRAAGYRRCRQADGAGRRTSPVVARLAMGRRSLWAIGRLLRQSGLRRRGHSLLPPSHGTCRGRSSTSGDGDRDRGQADGRRGDHHLRRRKRCRRSAFILDGTRGAFSPAATNVGSCLASAMPFLRNRRASGRRRFFN